MRSFKLAALAASLVIPTVGVAEGSSNFGLSYKRPQEQDGEVAYPWASPSMFSARLRERGASASWSHYYSTLQGRKLENREALVTITPDPKAMIWLAKQEYVAIGKGGFTRFRVKADTYGFRYIVKTPDEAGRSIAIQGEAYKPGSAFALLGVNSSGVFFPTKDWTVAVIFSDPQADYQLSYTNVEGAGSGQARILDLAVAKEWTWRESIRGRAEAHLAAQTLEDNGFENVLEFRPYFQGVVSFKPASWLSLDLEGLVMPFGTTVGGTRLTPFTSFQIYNPGGPVEGLRSKFIVLGVARLQAQFRF